MKVVRYQDFEKELSLLRDEGYRLDMIMPADAPREAIVSKNGKTVRVVAENNPKSEPQNTKSKGRAGMEYRDLIPGRLGGRAVASHIGITEGGDVPDYVHYHKLRFQMIYCRAGRIRVVYEGQGGPFDLFPGDCVLQPPEIRHRVLDADAGSEVIEISSPAEHETWVDHEIKLPTSALDRERDYDGQKFVRHRNPRTNERIRELGIAEATRGLAGAKVMRFAGGEEACIADARFEERCTFVFVLQGAVTIADARSIDLKENDSIVLEDAAAIKIRASQESEMLVVDLPADD